MAMMMKKKNNKLFSPEMVDHAKVLETIIEESSPRRTYLMLLIASAIMATLGLLNNSIPVVIGGMLVAPLLWPLMGFSMGLLLLDWRMIRLSVISIIWSLILAISVGVILTFFYFPHGADHAVFTQVDRVIMWPVAVAAGAVAAFAVCYAHLKEALPGVAVAVALVPPLASLGIGLGAWNWQLAEKAATVLLVDFSGIILISVLIFWLLGFRAYKKSAENAVAKEETVLEDKQ